MVLMSIHIHQAKTKAVLKNFFISNIHSSTHASEDKTCTNTFFIPLQIAIVPFSLRTPRIYPDKYVSKDTAKARQ
jgi:hypothetical protein